MTRMIERLSMKLQMSSQPHPIHIQLVRYFSVALIGLVVDFGLVIFTKEILGLYYLASICIGFICGLFVTYILSNMFVFGQPKTSPKTLFFFFGVIGIVGLGILNLLVFLFTDIVGINYIISKAIATIAVFMWNFFARRSLYHD